MSPIEIELALAILFALLVIMAAIIGKRLDDLDNEIKELKQQLGKLAYYAGRSQQARDRARSYNLRHAKDD